MSVEVVQVSVEPMPRTVQMPCSGSMLEALEQVSDFANAIEWYRAALVAALVGPAPGKGRRRKDEKSSYLLVDELAEKKIAGLRSKDTIRRYRDDWLYFREVPEPLSVIDLEGLPEWENRPSAAPYRYAIGEPDAVQLANAEENRKSVSRKLDREVSMEESKNYLRDVAGVSEDDDDGEEEPKPRRRPLPDQMLSAGQDLRRITTKLRNISEDDRFVEHHEKARQYLAGYLRDAEKLIEELKDELGL